MPSRTDAHERTVPRPLHAADPEALARVAFVLVGTSHAGNVGAAARAMRTMGLADLRLVAPRFDDVARRPEARAFASGATAVLDAARRFDTLAEAIGDAALAIAVSAEPSWWQRARKASQVWRRSPWMTAIRSGNTSDAHSSRLNGVRAT